MTSSAEQMRAWSGPAILSYGFRPFFLMASLWVALAMALWMAMLSGGLILPTGFDPFSWHAHEALFGFLGAVVCGFLLTAVPNWTGRLPVVGWPLLGLLGLWLAGRVAVSVSAGLPWAAVAAVDLACHVVLTAVILREIVIGKNWRNLMVLGLLAAFVAGNALFHWEAAHGRYPAAGYGLRLGLAAAVMMIAVIGGRIVPSFTGNWLAKRGGGVRPAPFGRFDRVALVVSLIALSCWVAAPGWTVGGFLLLVAGLVQAGRLARWAGRRTGSEPLVWILHVGYAFVPLGMLAMGTAIVAPGVLTASAAQHLWTAGAIGVMTLAVMTRASLGHTGRALAAGAGTTALYLLAIAAALVRASAGLAPQAAGSLYTLSAALWCAAFLGFAVLYGPALMRPRETG